jgi:hypothetical protein
LFLFFINNFSLYILYMFSTTTSEDVLLYMKVLEEVRMKRKQIEKEEEHYVDQLAAAIRRLPSTANPSLSLSASLFPAVFQQANLQVLSIENVPQKRKKEVDNNEEEESNNIIPLKMPKIEKEEDNNTPKKRKEKYLPRFKR